MSTKIMIVGDLHGNLDRASLLAEIAKDHGCEAMVQAGDWGFIWPRSTNVDGLQTVLDSFVMNMRFCDGNHDVHPALRALPEGIANVKPNITYQRRGSMAEIGGIKFVFMGGAPSIDKMWRTEHISWWKEETIEPEDVEAACKWADQNIDVLVTHDYGEALPGFKSGGSDDFRYHAKRSIESVNTVLKALKPKFHFHGHYHHRYTRVFNQEGQGPTIVHGMGADVNDISDNYFILEKDGDYLGELRDKERPFDE